MSEVTCVLYCLPASDAQSPAVPALVSVIVDAPSNAYASPLHVLVPGPPVTTMSMCVSSTIVTVAFVWCSMISREPAYLPLGPLAPYGQPSRPGHAAKETATGGFESHLE